MSSGLRRDRASARSAPPGEVLDIRKFDTISTLMKTARVLATRVMALAALIVGSVLTLDVVQAQQAPPHAS